MGRRRRARELAFLALYQSEVLGAPSGSAALADLIAERHRPAEVAGFAALIVESFDRHRAAVDRVIRETSPRWELERMPATDRAVLRLAVTELLLVPGIPEPVTINEAVDIAKRYGGDESGRFVNGVLDAVRKRLLERWTETGATSAQDDPAAGRPGDA